MSVTKGARLIIFAPKTKHNEVGLTAKANQVTLMHGDVKGIFKPSAEAPPVRIVEIDGGAYDFTVLIADGLTRKNAVFSGRYAYGEALSALGILYPLPLYDVKSE